MMKKIFFIFIILLAFTNCAGLYTKDNYRIKSVENNCYYETNSNISELYLTKSIGEDKNDKGRVLVKVRIYDKTLNYNYNVVAISSFKEDFVINGKRYISEREKYNKPEILNDVIITKKNGKKIIINKNQIEYTYKEDPNTNFKEALIYLPEILSGPITLELGRVKIGDEIYNVPKIYMQKYRVTESYSLVGAMLEEGGEHLPGYHSEGWVED